MLNPFDTGIRRTAALFAVVGLVALAIVPVAVGKPVPGANVPSIQDLRTQGNNWAAKARLLKVDGGVRTGILSSAQDVRTHGRWAAQGHLPLANGAIVRHTLPSAQDIETQGNNWAAKGTLLNANGGLLKDMQSDVTGSDRFHWNEFGIGAGAMLGLVLLLGVVAVGIHVVHSSSLSEGRPA